MRTNPLTKYWVIALMGMVISFLLFYLINDRKVQKNKIIAENAISNVELKITDELQKIQLVMESMSFFLQNTPHISQEVFQNFTNPFKDNLNGITALEWAPSILESEKIEFLNETSEESLTSIKESDDTNDLILSRTKSIYYPISLINPSEELEQILGFDLYSENNRKSAIQESTRSKEIAFTAPLELIKDNNDLPGILAVKAVFEPDSPKVMGVVAVVYRMDEFLQNVLSNEMEILDITIKDRLANDALLFRSRQDVENAKNSNIRKLSITAANRIWDVSLTSKPNHVQFPHTVASYFVLILSLMTTILVLTNLKARDERSSNLEKKVWQRTKELEVSNKQKENLLREIHHRVMNNLQITSSLMNLQKRKLQDEEAIYALSSSQDRINAIALIHKKIYQHDGTDAVDLKGYLENLIKSHKRISPSVSYTIDCPEVFIDLDTAVPLAIITSEIVVNALKHAFEYDDVSNHLYILVTQMKDDVIDIVISDNGKGIPKTKNVGETSGLGYDIIKKLCRQLEASYEYSSSKSGTAFSLRFKQRKLQMPVFA